MSTMPNPFTLNLDNGNNTNTLKRQPKTLADKAMLVRVKISRWSGTARDKDETNTYKATKGAGSVNKHLLKGSTRFKYVREALSQLYDYHTSTTVPWLDDGMRLLPQSMYFEYTAKMRELQRCAEHAIDDLVHNWEAEVRADMEARPDGGSRDDYPTDISGKFGVSLKFLPVPSEYDWRVKISDEDKQSLNNAIAEAQSDVAVYLIKRIMEPVRRLANRCREFEGEQGQRWKNSVVTSVKEVCDMVSKINLSDSAEVDKLAQEISEIVEPHVHDGSLKDNSKQREEVADKLDLVIDKMSGLFGS